MARARVLAAPFPAGAHRTTASRDTEEFIRVLAAYEETVATTERLLASIHDELRRLSVAMTRREDARAALERFQVHR